MKTTILVALVAVCSALACSDSGDDGGAPSGGGAGNGGGAQGGGGAGPGDATDDGASGRGGGSGPGGADSSGAGGGSGSDAADSNPRDSAKIDADSGRSADGTNGDSPVDLDASDGSNRRCGGTTCTATQVCVAYRVVGGVVRQPDDAGHCDSGRHIEPIGDANAFCFADFAYQCVELVGCAATPVSCTCANMRNGDSVGTCPVGFPACSDPRPSSWLDPAAQLICEQQVP